MPHGLVWQAMSAPEKPDDDGDPSPAIGPTIPPIPPTGPSPDPPLPQPLLPKQIDVSPVSAPTVPASPPFWRSLKIEHTINQPSVNKAISSAGATTRALQSSLAIKSKAVADISKQVLNRTRELSGRTLPLFLRIRTQLAQTGNACASWSANTVVQMRNGAAEYNAQTMLQIRRHTPNLKTQAGKAFDSVSAYAKLRSRRSPVQLPLLDLDPADREGWNVLKSKAQASLKGLPLLIRLLILRSMAEMRMPHSKRPTDSSLRTLALTASLAALFVMGLVSATRHYATVSLPSHFSDITSAAAFSSVPAKPKVPAVLAASPVTANSTMATTTNTKAATEPNSVSKPSHVEAKHPANGSVARPRRHHTDDDDYVARDTYVYYGNRPNTSR